MENSKQEKSLTLNDKILLYLKDVRCVQRKKVYQPFLEYDYKHYAKVIQKMIVAGEIEIVKKNGGNYIQITNIGSRKANAICEKNNIENAVSVNTRSGEQRQQMYADIIGLCMASGIHVTDKPKLEMLYEVADLENSKTAIQQFTNGLKKGVYYSKIEIMNAYKKVFGKTEIAKASRITGVIFCRRKLMFVYSVGTSLIAWNIINEKKGIDLCVDFFKHSEHINNLIDIDWYESIVIGKSTKMVPALVCGNKNGVNKMDKLPDSFQKANRAKKINAENLAEVFPTAYFVPTTRIGINMLKFVCAISYRARKSLAEKWFDAHDECLFTPSMKYTQGIYKNNKESVVYVPYIDLIELLFYRKRSAATHFIIPKGTQEAISRTMGPLLLSAESLKGTHLEYHKYDYDGHLLNGVWLDIRGDKNS